MPNNLNTQIQMMLARILGNNKPTSHGRVGSMAALGSIGRQFKSWVSKDSSYLHSLLHCNVMAINHIKIRNMDFKSFFSNLEFDIKKY
jgi:hypothetical protein